VLGFTGEAKGRWRWRCAIGATGLLIALWVLALAGRESRAATGDGCTPNCVILIQVDGLEPKDVTPAATPYLWALAHPQVQGRSIPGGALNNRSGWIWQAPRGVVSTGTASATASLLTGAYPEFSGVPSDDFYDPSTKADDAHQRLGAGGFGDQNLAGADGDPSHSPDGAGPVSSSGVDTLVEAAHETGDVAVFLGDPALAKIAHAGSDATAFWYPPGDADSASTPEQNFTGDPRLCPIPRYPEDTGSQGSDQPDPSSCPADDLVTMNKAAKDLGAGTAAGVGFTFIELAELGVAKRGAGDPDVTPDNTPPQPAEALADTDAAIASFVEQYAQKWPDKWPKTVVMVVGSHGYQTTPLADRVPDPRPVDPNEQGGATHDLSDYVADVGPDGKPRSELRLVPQGTMATIYYKPATTDPIDPAARAAALQKVKNDLLNTVNPACASLNPALGPCIKEVDYVDDSTQGTPDTVAAKHPSWHLDARDPDSKARTGTSGDLVVVLEPGWATGRAAGTPNPGGTLQVSQPWSNPYTASSGGPRERAVAALINGPLKSDDPGAVRNLDTFAPGANYYPVSNKSVDPKDHNNPPPANDPACPGSGTDPSTATDFGGLACANSPENVGDDAGTTGHEAQPVTVDFAVTISALMKVPFDSHPEQLQGRVLQEAFLNGLATPCVGEDCDPPPPEPPPPAEPEPLPPPPVEVIRPPGFNFHGLVRRLKARVVDGDNHTYPQAKPGALMSTVRLAGDFGKEEAAVTLTFYRKVRAGQSHAASVTHLRAIARFDPFAVKRGHVVMRLKIPPVFKPTYVGLTVQEITRVHAASNGRSPVQCTTIKPKKPLKFMCVGPKAGRIPRIVDARRLHQRKPRRGGRRHR
jgi:hypothetical protein